MPQMKPLGWGEQAPSFHAYALEGSPTYAFDTVAGRLVVMLFFGDSSIDACAGALDLIAQHRGIFDDERACFFGVTVTPEDVTEGRIAQDLPGIRFFLDFDRRVSTLFGAVDGNEYLPHWLILDPQLRVLRTFEVSKGAEAIEFVKSFIAEGASSSAWAPVLVVSNVLEPEFCQHLIELYEQDGGAESGFMREVGGKTVTMLDPAHKMRRDFMIEDEALRRSLAGRLVNRLNPPIKKAFQFYPTRMERYLVACYQPGAGHFRPHRDNTTKGTAHRKFAVTINLNADFDGGDLCFPEFGQRRYRAPLGGAVVFSCSLLHEATPVLRGKRYAFLPFLYDEETAAIREANNPHLGEGIDHYRKDDAQSAG